MLYLVATPIGHPQDISYRAVELLKSADLIIGEERKEVTSLLKQWQATGRPIELLNEHSDSEDIEFLVGRCRELKTVVLVSDCGTPGFCDPGADLVSACRKAKVEVTSVPGPSSLMSLLSLAGHRIEHFLFRGFLPAKGEGRQRSWRELQAIPVPVVLLDTPYRLDRVLDELEKFFPERQVILALNLTLSSEDVIEASPKELKKLHGQKKAEFILIIQPRAVSSSREEKGSRPVKVPRKSKKYPKRH